MQGSDAFNYNVFYSKDPKYKDKGGTEFKKHGQADEMRDKYFTQDDTGGYKLKEGYVQRHIGTGDLEGKMQGAEMTYASAVDDDNNEKENLGKRNNYGIFKKEVPKAAAAPVAAPKPEAAPPKPQGPPSQTLQDAMNTVKAKGPRTTTYTSGKTDADRQALTDSFKQKSYDPNAGIASEKAGNFLDDYKLNLNSKITKMRSQYNPNPNGGE